MERNGNVPDKVTCLFASPFVIPMARCGTSRSEEPPIVSGLYFLVSAVCLSVVWSTGCHILFLLCLCRSSVFELSPLCAGHLHTVVSFSCVECPCKCGFGWSPDRTVFCLVGDI